MKFRLADWASLAEIVASVTVVVTLILLTIDVRENTEIVRANSCDNLLSDVNDQSFVIVQKERLLGEGLCAHGASEDRTLKGPIARR